MATKNKTSYSPLIILVAFLLFTTHVPAQKKLGLDDVDNWSAKLSKNELNEANSV